MKEKLGVGQSEAALYVGSWSSETGHILGLERVSPDYRLGHSDTRTLGH